MDKIIATSVGFSGASVEELSKESETRTHYKDFETAVSLASQITEIQGDFCTVSGHFLDAGRVQLRHCQSGEKD